MISSLYSLIMSRIIIRLLGQDFKKGKPKAILNMINIIWYYNKINKTDKF